MTPWKPEYNLVAAILCLMCMAITLSTGAKVIDGFFVVGNLVSFVAQKGREK